MNRVLRPGFGFRQGRLLITTDAETKRLDCWPDLKAARQLIRQKAWTSFVPVFLLLRPKAAASDSLGPNHVPSLALSV